MTDPTVLRAVSGADFLAALPRLTGMDAPESCYIVRFGSGAQSRQATGTARIDLPEKLGDQIASAFPGPELENWLRYATEIATRGVKTVVVVMQTESPLTDQPAVSPHGTLTAVVADILQAMEIDVIDALVVGADGWASFATNDAPELCSLDEITSSRLYSPDHVALSIDEWRAQHPGQTAEDPSEIDELVSRMMREANGAASSTEQNRSTP